MVNVDTRMDAAISYALSCLFANEATGMMETSRSNCRSFSGAATATVTFMAKGFERRLKFSGREHA
eukprot:scaffold4784_cov229-Alexandrium_tamarense.AAC.2